MFTRATEYAIRACIYIAKKSHEKHKISLEEIATSIDSPVSFTAKILQQLTKNPELLQASRGPHGGFYMTETAKNLPVKTILETMGELEILCKCILGLAKCSSKEPCPVHEEYASIREKMLHLFETNSIEWLAGQTKNGNFYLNNGFKLKS